MLAKKTKTTWFWSFNVFVGTIFERKTLVDGLHKFILEKTRHQVSKNTIKRDVDCFIRSYVTRNNLDDTTLDDMVESPFSELDLIRSTGHRDGFQFMRGPKSTLSNKMFASAVVDFWSNFQDSNTISFESLLYGAGSPGRVFLLDEESLTEKLSMIESVTEGKVRWSESAGMRQLLRDEQFPENYKLDLIESDLNS